MMKRFAAIALLACLSGCATADGPGGAPQLDLVDIARVPFSLGFDDKSEIPVGTNICGFVAVKFTPKVEERVLPSGATGRVDVSELTLKRGESLITLVKGRRVSYQQLAVHLVDRSSGKEFGVMTGEEINIGSRRLRLREVNVEELNCTLQDVTSGEQFTIKRMAQPESGHVRK